MPKLVIVIIVMEEKKGLILGHPGGKGRKGGRVYLPSGLEKSRTAEGGRGGGATLKRKVIISLGLAWADASGQSFDAAYLTLLSQLPAYLVSLSTVR